MREFVCGDGGGSRGMGICGLVRGWVGELYVGVSAKHVQARNNTSSCMLGGETDGHKHRQTKAQKYRNTNRNVDRQVCRNTMREKYRMFVFAYLFALDICCCCCCCFCFLCVLFCFRFVVVLRA